MTLSDLLETVVTSEPTDWRAISCGGTGSPSYRDIFSANEDGKGRWMGVESHYASAVLRADVSITMAWGLTVVDDFQEPWTDKFPDKRAASHHVDLFFNGALVYRAMYVTVDGGRCYLPLAEGADFPVVPARYSRFIRLLNALSRTDQDSYESYLYRAGFLTTDDPWPKDLAE